MIVDTSALVAIVLGEPEGLALDESIRRAESRRISVATCVELLIVLSSKLAVDARPVLDRLITDYGLQIVDVDQAQMSLAFDGVARFGKGRHPAKLNLGDCFAYGLSRALDEPLLFKGDDFGRTDVAVARY